MTKAPTTPRPASAGPCSSAAASVPSATSPEQDERGGRHQEAVQRIGRIDGGKRHRRSGGGQDGRDIGDRQRLDGGDALLAARPFAGQQQGQREQAAQHRAHAGAEQAGLDRIAHHEESAERQRQSADPHHPAGADRFLEAAIGLRQRRRWCRRAACGLIWDARRERWIPRPERWAAVSAQPRSRPAAGSARTLQMA